ncbi:predicted protein [Coccidioides posadasii str. Silveira]|uniref:Predicted protein n=2 Tax=Coccidioides posadasii TaxID=199306 RepID=E9CX64_COCPS|nr:predicted protein [Coccidioides posadasii str. Silveira]KMM65350.1 hypothetical protein CPAG_01701 [Coccidioides posadasii RMSCC 3488]
MVGVGLFHKSIGLLELRTFDGSKAESDYFVFPRKDLFLLGIYVSCHCALSRVVSGFHHIVLRGENHEAWPAGCEKEGMKNGDAWYSGLLFLVFILGLHGAVSLANRSGARYGAPYGVPAALTAMQVCTDQGAVTFALTEEQSYVSRVTTPREAEEALSLHHTSGMP